MFKSLFKYLGIGIVIGVGITIVSEVHYHIVQERYEEDLEGVMEIMREMRTLSVIDSDDLFHNNLPDKYYNPENDLFFSIQSISDFEDHVELSGILTNRGTDTWSYIVVDFDVYNKAGYVLASCDARGGKLAPTATDALVVYCPKVGKYKNDPVGTVDMQIKWNYHGERVVMNK